MRGQDVVKADSFARMGVVSFTCISVVLLALAAGKNGKALVERTCNTKCHNLDVIKAQRITADEWRPLVQTMVGRGAKATPAQVETIVEYLAKTYGPR